MTTETARAYYRRKGWNPGYGHKVKTQGRLVSVFVDGKELIDIEASDARMAATADPAKVHMAGVNEQQRVVHRSPATQPPAPAAQPSSFGEVSKNATYMQAKTAREVYEAKNAQLEYEERSGKLIRVESVRAALAVALATAREALLQLPARLAPLLAAEQDAGAIQSALYGEIHQVLDNLSRTSARMGEQEDGEA